jgi:hypothetical protein
MLIADLEKLDQIAFNRKALDADKEYGIHIFCDASQEGFGFVIYACDRNRHSQILFAKTKVAPQGSREYGIPTLELLAVILALKCLPSVLEAYKEVSFEFLNICVDAQVVLTWLISKQTKSKSKFLKNRIKDLVSLTDNITNKYKIPFKYSYVNTTENPADLLTRGISFKKFVENFSLWTQGPCWLSNVFEEWPKYPLQSVPPDVKHLVMYSSKGEVPEFLDIKRFSNFTKLIRFTSLLYKPFCLKTKTDPYQKAVKYWILQVQKECFSEEIEFLRKAKLGQTKTNYVPTLVANLNLFLDDEGVIRSKGRLSRSTFYKYEVQSPVLLPKNHYFTELVINDCHNAVQHLGVNTTLNCLRNRGFWVTKARQAIRSVLNKCIYCRKFNAFAFRFPKPTAFSKGKLDLIIPFKHTGIDFTGHTFVRDEKTGNTVKMYILVFTCLHVRAVHLEILPDMSTEHFLLAFRRFCNMYIVPDFLYSDNAKSFIKGGNMLKNCLKSDEFQQELTNHNIKHVRIPLYAAWVGSAWERLIRVLKSCMYKVIGKETLTYFELFTILSSIKQAINSRPLTYVTSSEPEEVITPNSFLKLNGNNSLILKETLSDDVWDRETIQSRLEKSLALQDKLFVNFRQMWYENYLLSLREYSRDLYQCSFENKIKVGDIVLVKHPFKSRPFWNMGRVLEVMIGYDNNIRFVKVKLSNGEVATHAINHLYPLELNITQGDLYNNPPAETVPEGEKIALDTTDRDLLEETDSVTNKKQRPSRKAARQCRRFIKKNIRSLK